MAARLLDDRQAKISSHYCTRWQLVLKMEKKKKLLTTSLKRQDKNIVRPG